MLRRPAPARGKLMCFVIFFFSVSVITGLLADWLAGGRPSLGMAGDGA